MRNPCPQREIFAPEDPASEGRPGSPTGAEEEPAFQEKEANSLHLLHFLPLTLCQLGQWLMQDELLVMVPIHLHLSTQVTPCPHRRAMHARSFNLGERGQFVQERSHTWDWQVPGAVDPHRRRGARPPSGISPRALPNLAAFLGHSLRTWLRLDGGTGGGVRQRKQPHLPSKNSHTHPSSGRSLGQLSHILACFLTPPPPPSHPLPVGPGPEGLPARNPPGCPHSPPPCSLRRVGELFSAGWRWV